MGGGASVHKNKDQDSDSSTNSHRERESGATVQKQSKSGFRILRKRNKKEQQSSMGKLERGEGLNSFK
ncbi:unnamed protein product [Allacma fusca]|uniref:Uncharacterized protein n=1 Tax=Allacma fusca TaxID=39272 RepID=A0A8J2P5W6_9HEXA|nr:unnamed protein product [Allacma fusca]